MGRPLTDEERSTFEAITFGDRMGLVQAQLTVDGVEREVAVICYFEEPTPNDFRLHPQAVLVTDDSPLMEMLRLDGDALKGGDDGEDGDANTVGGSADGG